MFIDDNWLIRKSRVAACSGCITVLVKLLPEVIFYYIPHYRKKIKIKFNPKRGGVKGLQKGPKTPAIQSGKGGVVVDCPTGQMWFVRSSPSSSPPDDQRKGVLENSEPGVRVLYC